MEAVTSFAPSFVFEFRFGQVVGAEKCFSLQISFSYRRHQIFKLCVHTFGLLSKEGHQIKTMYIWSAWLKFCSLLVDPYLS